MNDERPPYFYAGDDERPLVDAAHNDAKAEGFDRFVAEERAAGRVVNFFQQADAAHQWFLATTNALREAGGDVHVWSSGEATVSFERTNEPPEAEARAIREEGD